MSSGVEQDAHALLRLVLRKLRSELEGPRNLSIEIRDLEVEVKHHLLAAGPRRPHRSHVVGVPLDAQVRDPLTEVEGRVIVVLVPDRPAAQVGVEPRQPRHVWRIQHHTPPVVPSPPINGPLARAALIHLATLGRLSSTARPDAAPEAYAGIVLDLDKLDLDEIATALADQTYFEHQWLIDPRTGEIVLWTSDAGIDGTNPVDLDELDLLAIDPLPSSVWYTDMADFAEGISDDTAGRRLGRAIRGRGAFRRFKVELLEEYPDLVPAWYAFRDARATRRAVEWLRDHHLVAEDAAHKFLVDHPEPDLP